MFMERRLITIAFHRNSSITLQEVALTRKILTFIASQYYFEVVEFNHCKLPVEFVWGTFNFSIKIGH